MHLRDIYKTLKGIGQIQFVSELRILTGKKQPKLNSNAFEKDKYEHLDGLDGLYEVLKLKQNFLKNKVVTSKAWFFVIGPFCTPHSICLNIGF